MAQRSCCVPGCSMKLGGGLPLHRFPNPNNPAQIERFRTWVMKIGGDIVGEDNDFIHRNRKVCHKHFEEVYTFPNMKLTALAIPTLQIPGVHVGERRYIELPSTPVQMTTASNKPVSMDIEDLPSRPVVNIELPSTSVQTATTSSTRPASMETDILFSKRVMNVEMPSTSLQMETATSSRPPQMGVLTSKPDTVTSPINNSPDIQENNENIPPEWAENVPPELVDNVSLDLVEDVQPNVECENTELRNEMVEEELAQEETLDDQVLEILGVDPQPEKVGDDLHKQIAQRWEKMLRKGLSKEEKEKIEEENAPFLNLQLMVPPKLNPEVSAAINEMSRKRDQIIEKRQKQIATALSCLGSGLQMCLKDAEGQKMNIIKKLNDASKLLCDSICLDTRRRRSLLLSIINKDMKEFLLQSESKTFLFGEDLIEKIRTAKSVKKSGQELKLAETKKFTPRQNTWVSRPNTSKNKALNWRGPPRTELKRGGQHPEHQQWAESGRTRKTISIASELTGGQT